MGGILARSALCALLCPALPAAGQELGEAIAFPHVCDGSAVVAIDDRLLVGNDESNTLWLYARDGTALGWGDLDGPLQAALGYPLNTMKEDGQRISREIDIEAAAAGDDRIYWVGSHGRNKDGQPRPNRRLFFATTAGVGTGPFSMTIVGRPVSLVEGLSGLPEFGERVREAADKKLAPADGGLNIEGLAANPEGGVVIGLRAPLLGEPHQGKKGRPRYDRGDALLVFFDNAADVLDSGAPAKMTGVALDLGDRGVRSLEWSPHLDAWVVVAGSVGSKHAPAVFVWKGVGHAPTRLGVVFSRDSNPEAMVVDAEGALLFDDLGTSSRTVDDITTICKNHLERHRLEQADKPFAERAPYPKELEFRGYRMSWPPENTEKPGP